MSTYRPVLVRIVIALFLFAASIGGRPIEAEGRRIYLPLITLNDAFVSTPALWIHNAQPGSHEVAPFRCTFVLSEPLKRGELALFADTRYGAWFDGAFVGRGPARFSRLRREYDRVRLGDLAPGRHVLAMLVQWAPNTRRSESTQPQARGALRGQVAEQPLYLPLEPKFCRAIAASAWNRYAPPIHTWGLIGPSEQLDFRQLPADWMNPEFDDSAWPAALVRPFEHAIFEERSIAPLVEVPMPVQVLERGYLGRHFWISELGRRGDMPATYQFTLAARTRVTIRTLALPELGDLNRHITLNGVPLGWEPIPGQAPDLLQAQLTLAAGRYSLAIGETWPDSEPWVFAISQAGVAPPPPMAGRGAHPGRRMLLPDLHPDESAVTVNATQPLDLSFGAGPTYVILDLGRTVHGRLRADVSGAAGTVIDIGWDERLWGGVRPLPYPGSLHPQWSQVDSWNLDGGTRNLATLDARSGRYVMIVVWGDQPVRMSNLSVVEERYPLVRQGSFVSEHERLNQIWRLGVETLYPSMTDAYADPWRERGQWWGDAHIADRVNQVVFGETALLRRGLLQVADSGRDGIPRSLVPNGDGYFLDYAALWVRSALDYGQLSGDWNFIAVLYPRIRDFLQVLTSLENPTTGLLDLGQSCLNRADVKAYIDAFSHWDRCGQSTAVNAYYYGALMDAATIAQQLGRQEDAQMWLQRADVVRSSANRLLYRSEDGRYAATLLDGSLIEATPQAQAAALAFGLAPPGEEQRVADSLLALVGTPENPRIQIFGMYTVLEALGRSGRIDDGLMIIDRFFGSMLDRGATTWWEHFHADRDYTASLSHAWGGSPTWFLSTYALGARRTGPSTWQFRFRPSRLRALSGTIPLDGGVLSVEWRHETCRQLTLAITSPYGSVGEVVFPRGAHDMELWYNQILVWPVNQSFNNVIPVVTNDAFQLNLRPGSHTLEIRRQCR